MSQGLRGLARWYWCGSHTVIKINFRYVRTRTAAPGADTYHTTKASFTEYRAIQYLSTGLYKYIISKVSPLF